MDGSVDSHMVEKWNWILKRMDIKTVNILGTRFSRINMKDTLKTIEKFITNGRESQVCVTNAYSLVLMQKDKEFKDITNSASLVVTDGKPLIWISKLYGEPIPERVAGPDLVYEFSKISAKKGYKLFFLGSDSTTLKKMIENLKKIFPFLQIVGAYAPPFKKQFPERENEKMLALINKVKSDILFVGLGAPKQERWIWEYKDKLRVPVSIGVGAAFDFVAGTVKRAPEWMQECGLEWLFRLCQEPGRLWKRYLIGNPIFLWLVLKEFIKVRILGRSSGLEE